MSTVDEIKAAIKRLDPDQRSELENWLEVEWDEWDRQIARDVKAGKFDAMFKEIERAAAAGELMDLP